MSTPRKTLVVNFMAGPGAGKTTGAWLVAGELKKAGIVTEYVPEYAKELVWEGRENLLDGSLMNQMAVLTEQYRRISRLCGKVDVIVTDSPLLLIAYYAKECREDVIHFAQSAAAEMNNFYIYMYRGTRFEREGRIHSQEESQKIDEELTSMMDSLGVFYGVYRHNQTPMVVVPNIKITLSKLHTS